MLTTDPEISQERLDEAEAGVKQNLYFSWFVFSKNPILVSESSKDMWFV